MLNPLEQYLAQLAQSLKSLPQQERAAEIQEIRQHLEFLIEERVENGDSLEEATRAAIAQFGSPANNGGDLRKAWRRGQNRSQWQDFRKRALVLVGTRNGKQVIHWPGVFISLVVMMGISSLVGAATLFLLGRSFFLLPQTIFSSTLMITGCVFIPAIKRALKMSPDQLVALD